MTVLRTAVRARDRRRSTWRPERIITNNMDGPSREESFHIVPMPPGLR